MNKKPPLFLVGVPRSGTTMLANMLSRHSSIACGPETHYFHYLFTLGGADKINDDSGWPDAAVSVLKDMTLNDRPVLEQYELSIDVITEKLSCKEKSLSSPLDTIQNLFMERQGKSRWLEKSPPHLLQVENIRKLFPASPIIRIVRDPRPVALSLKRVPWASDSLVANLYLWNEWMKVSHAFFADDALAITVRYEDILRDSEKELKRICDFVGEDYEEDMIKADSGISKVVSKEEWWKGNVTESPDATRLETWKSEFPNNLDKVCSLICSDLFTEFGYGNGMVTKEQNFFPSNRKIISALDTWVLNAADHKVRLNPLGYFKHDIRFLSESESGVIIVRMPQLGSSTLARGWGLLHLCSVLFVRKLKGKDDEYLDLLSESQQNGIVGQLFWRFVKLIGLTKAQLAP